MLTGRRSAGLERVAADIRAATGGTAHVRAGDVTQAAEPRAIARCLSDALGRIDILVNNAGSNIRERSWAERLPERGGHLADLELGGCRGRMTCGDRV